MPSLRDSGPFALRSLGFRSPVAPSTPGYHMSSLRDSLHLQHESIRRTTKPANRRSSATNSETSSNHSRTNLARPDFIDDGWNAAAGWF